jgi:hypothetical protein
MGFPSDLSGGKGQLLGRITLLNRPAGLEHMILVHAVPVESGAPPPYPGEPPEEVRSEEGTVSCGLGQLEFMLELPAGHYQLCAQLAPCVVSQGEVEVDSSQQFITWPLPSALTVTGEEPQRVTLEIDLRHAGHKGWQQGYVRPTGEELRRGVISTWSLPVFSRLPLGLREPFAKAIHLQQGQRHTEVVAVLEALLIQLRADSSSDLKELTLLAQAALARSLLALGRAEEALSALRNPPKGLESEDLTSCIDYMYTQVDCLGHLGELNTLAQAMTKTIGLCVEAQAAEPLQKTLELAFSWMLEKGGPAKALELAEAFEGAPFLEEVPPLGLVMADFRWEALAALGRSQEALQVARSSIRTLETLQAPLGSALLRTWQRRLQGSAFA